MMLRPFHLAVTVDDLAAARAFYGAALGCAEGRSAERWVDFDFMGHQFVVHLDEAKRRGEAVNPVDGHDVPVPHFGVVLTPEQFETLAARLTAAGVQFVHPPMLRFVGLPGEQWTMFLCDPAGNALEFKAFADDKALFAALPLA